MAEREGFEPSVQVLARTPNVTSIVTYRTSLPDPKKRTAGAFGSAVRLRLVALQLRAIKTSSLFDSRVASRSSLSRLFSSLDGAITIPLVPAPFQIAARKY
jgi:hypothetical protein